MPSELRILDFSQSEVYEALLAYCKQTRRDLPELLCTGLMLSQTQETKIALAMNHGQPEITETSEIRATLSFAKSHATFSESEIGGALVMHCMKKELPIAKRAVKSITISGEGVHLHLRMDGKTYGAGANRRPD